MVGRKGTRDVFDSDQGADHQPGEHEQRQGKRNFRHDKAAEQAALRPASGGTEPLSAAARRGLALCHAGARPKRRTVRSANPIEASRTGKFMVTTASSGMVSVGTCAGWPAVRRRRSRGNRHGNGGEQERFGEGVAQEAQAGSSDSGADDELVLAIDGAGQQQAGDIDAGDEQENGTDPSSR